MKDDKIKKFIKYGSIENYYNLEKIWDKYAPFLPKRTVFTWQITEKIHGTNICVSNRYKEGPAFFTRNGNQLPPVLQEMMKSYDWEIFFKDNPEVDFVYGEGAGTGIQKGVDYGDEKKYYIFDMKDKDGIYVHPPKVYYINHGIFYYVPVVKTIMATFEDVVKALLEVFKLDPVSEINPKEGNILEGYVVKCIEEPMLTPETRFIFKVKHPNFDEKRNRPKRDRMKKFDDTDYSVVEPYVNENRAQSAMSKFPGYTKSKIGDVMREIVKDVQKDMKKDGLRWDKKYSKYINKQVSKIVVTNADV